MHRTQRMDGFTLIELLVVIIIIGILAAIALPLYLHQRERAKDAAMQEGLHGVQVGIQTVAADDAAGRFPTEAEVASGGSVGAVVTKWPADPYRGGDMVDEGARPGHFDYEVSTDRSTYTLVGFLSSGDWQVQ